MVAVLHLVWDLSQPGARCSIDDLERAVHSGGLSRFTGMAGLHQKIWFRDHTRYGSMMVFESAEARDACLEWITERVTGVCGLPPARVETWDGIAVAEGAAGPVPPDRSVEHSASQTA